jgi:hypothetical protein
MKATWNFIFFGAVTLASAAGIVGGEAGKGELRIAESAASMSLSSETPALLTGGSTSAQ